MDKINFGKLAAILLLSGLFLLAASLRAEWKDGRMFRGAVLTQGLVLDRYTTSGGSSAGSPGTEMVVRYVDAAGAKHKIKKLVEESFWNQHPPGRPVVVRYVPKHPTEAWLVGDSSGDRWGMRKVMGSALLVLLGLVSVWLHREYK